FHISFPPSFRTSFRHSNSILHSSLSFVLSSDRTALLPVSIFSFSTLHSSLTMYPGVCRSTPSTHLTYFSCTLSTSSYSFHPHTSAPYIRILPIRLSKIIFRLLKLHPNFLSPILQTL